MEIIRSNWNSAKTDEWASPAGGAIFNGISQKYDLIDSTNVVETSFVVKGLSLTTTEQLVYLGTNMLISSASGTVTLGSALTNATVYVDNVETTTLTANSKLVLIQFDSVDISTGYLGSDGTNFGAYNIIDLHFRNLISDASGRKARWNNGKPHEYIEPYVTRDASNAALHTAFTNSDFDTFTVDGTGFNAANTAPSANENCYSAITCEIGKTYKVFFNYTLNSGTDVFFKVSLSAAGSSSGALIDEVPASGDNTFTFVATATTHYLIFFSNTLACDFTIANSVTCNSQGNTFSVTPKDFGTNGAICKVGGVTSIMNSTASPIAVSKGVNEVYRDARATIATATPTTMQIPKGYVIKEIRAKGSAGLTAIKIGTSSSGGQIVASTTTTGTTPKILTLAATAKASYSESADTTIYVEHTTAGQTMNVILVFEKVGV